MNQKTVCLIYEVDILTHPVCITTLRVICKQFLGGNSVEVEVNNNNPFTYISDTLLGTAFGRTTPSACMTDRRVLKNLSWNTSSFLSVDLKYIMRAKPPSSELYQARVLERLVRPANLNMDTGAANKANIGQHWTTPNTHTRKHTRAHSVLYRWLSRPKYVLHNSPTNKLHHWISFTLTRTKDCFVHTIVNFEQT